MVRVHGVTSLIVKFPSVFSCPGAMLRVHIEHVVLGRNQGSSNNGVPHVESVRRDCDSPCIQWL